MPAGRPRKPTAIHVLNGNPSKIPDLETRFAQEPQFEQYTPQNVPPPPKRLLKVGAECWKVNTPMLAAQHLLTQADLAMLEVYCDTWEKYCRVNDEINRVGSMVYKPHARTQPNSTYLDTLPQVRLRAQLSKQLLEISREFGMTPAARGRMISPEAKEEEDAMARLIRGAR